MNYREDEKIEFNTQLVMGILISIVGVIAIIYGCCATSRIYSVWSQRKLGEAELAHAESNRKIKTLEAKASEESSKHLAQAEIIRAHGVAEANKIIGDSLRENEAYLRYLWITNLESKNKEIIYIPTEANLPIFGSWQRQGLNYESRSYHQHYRCSFTNPKTIHWRKRNLDFHNVLGMDVSKILLRNELWKIYR